MGAEHMNNCIVICIEKYVFDALKNIYLIPMKAEKIIKQFQETKHRGMIL